MAYADTYNTADSAGFQHSCYVAIWMVALDIANDVNATVQRKDWAAKVLTEKMNITPRQLAFQLLRNSALLAAGAGATDQQFLTSVLERLDDLVKVG